MLDSSDHLKNLAFAVPQSPETPRPLAAPSHRGPSHRLQARMPKPIPLFPLDDTPEDSGQDQRDITKTADQSLDERPAVVDPGTGQSHGSDPDGLPDRKPSICAGVMAHDEQRDQTWQALLDGNYRPGTDDFRCYRRHGRLVFTQKDDGGADVICEFDDATMRNLLSDRIAWYVVDRSGKRQPARPPGILVRDLPKTPHQHLPVLSSVSIKPFLCASGDQLVTANGYYRAERTLLACPVAVDQHMPLADARSAMDYLLQDFPFDSAADYANGWAAALTPLIDRYVTPTPLFLFGKPTSRTGATLLCETLAIVHTGRLPDTARISSQSSDETAKALATAGTENHGIILFDNLSGTINSRDFAEYLTQTIYRQRRLGSNRRHVVVDRRGITEYATANNLRLSTELLGRTVSIRLDAGIPEPGTRTDFAIKNIKEYATENRPLLLSSLCSVVQHWMDSGQPEVDEIPALGGFEQWRRTCAGILNAAGITGFLRNASRFRESSEDRSEDITDLVQAWWTRYREEEVTNAQILELVESHGHLSHVLADAIGEGVRARQTRMGNLLSGNRDRVFRLPDSHLNVRVLWRPVRSRGSRHRLRLETDVAAGRIDSTDAETGRSAKGPMP